MAVIDGTPQVRRTAMLCATFDHRVVDGVLAGRLARTLRELLEGFGREEPGPRESAPAAAPEPSEQPQPA